MKRAGALLLLISLLLAACSSQAQSPSPTTPPTTPAEVSTEALVAAPTIELARPTVLLISRDCARANTVGYGVRDAYFRQETVFFFR